MIVKVKSIHIGTLEDVVKSGSEKTRVDKSIMTFEEMQEMKTKISELLGIHRVNVIVHYEGRE
jgi:hypothetical protein